MDESQAALQTPYFKSKEEQSVTDESHININELFSPSPVKEQLVEDFLDPKTRSRLNAMFEQVKIFYKPENLENIYMQSEFQGDTTYLKFLSRIMTSLFQDVLLSPIVNEDLIFQVLTVNEVYPSSLREAISQMKEKGEIRYFNDQQVNEVSFIQKAFNCCKHGVTQIPNTGNLIVHVGTLNRFIKEFISWAGSSYQGVMSESEFDRQINLTLSGVEQGHLVVQLMKDTMKANHQLDCVSAQLDCGAQLNVIKLSDCLDSKITQNDVEVFKARMAIKKFQQLLNQMKQLKINENQSEIKNAVLESALKQLQPFETIITQAYSQVLAYREEGQEIPAHRLLKEIQKAIAQDTQRLDHLQAILTNHTLSERNFEQIRELVGIEIVQEGKSYNRMSKVSYKDSLMHIR